VANSDDISAKDGLKIVVTAKKFKAFINSRSKHIQFCEYKARAINDIEGRGGTGDEQQGKTREYTQLILKQKCTPADSRANRRNAIS
jgi:hypothetical protein